MLHYTYFTNTLFTFEELKQWAEIWCQEQHVLDRDSAEEIQFRMVSNCLVGLVVVATWVVVLT